MKRERAFQIREEIETEKEATIEARENGIIRDEDIELGALGVSALGDGVKMKKLYSGMYNLEWKSEDDDLDRIEETQDKGI